MNATTLITETRSCWWAGEHVAHQWEPILPDPGVEYQCPGVAADGSIVAVNAPFIRYTFGAVTALTRGGGGRAK